MIVLTAFTLIGALTVKAEEELEVEDEAEIREEFELDFESEEVEVDEVEIEEQVDEHGNLRIKNDYISIAVNQEEENTGRFAVDVTGGNPIMESDEGKPLIYGRPTPWASYTTIRIDGEDYVFGGETNQRAGRLGEYGEEVKAPYITDEGAIETVYRYGDLLVIQNLSFVRSSTTGLPDTAQIKYELKNESEEVKEVGVRAMLDTMVGDNDGAPFRVGPEPVTTDTMYTQDELPEFWQAFDRLSDPMVIAQGTVKGSQVTAPDEIYFSNWGSLADGVWDFDFEPGREFIREGEFQLDSAMALYWNPEPLPPGESRTYITNYGLGGITIVPGILSLGVTSPAEVVLDKQTDSFPVLAYIQNTAEIDAEDVAAEIKLPSGLSLAEGEAKKELGDLESGGTRQLVWDIVPEEGVSQEVEYKVEVTAENTDDNEVSRRVDIIGPPELSFDLLAPAELEVEDRLLEPNPFKVTTTVKNTGASTAYSPSLEISLPPGLRLARGERDIKYLGYLSPGEEVDVSWYLEATGIKGQLPYAIELSSVNADSKSKLEFIDIPEVEAAVYLESHTDDLRVGDYLQVTLNMANLNDFYKLNTILEYDVEKLELLFASRGTLFTKGDKLLSWEEPQVDTDEGRIELAGALEAEEDILNDKAATFYFRVNRAGPLSIGFSHLDLIDEEGVEIDSDVEDLEFTIRGGEDYD
ncbi:cellulosome anchor protein [Fuchsiella alkaliacetigena]|nr:cellulosome anchor protein [Fuchsiella alkaliacetigena]